MSVKDQGIPMRLADGSTVHAKLAHGQGRAWLITAITAGGQRTVTATTHEGTEVSVLARHVLWVGWR